MQIEVQIFTASHIVRGFIETDGDRVSDVLNLRTEPGLVISNVEAAALPTLGKSAPLRLPRARIEKASILFAVPVEKDMTHKSIFRKANRLAYEVAAILPPFEVQGTVYLTERFEARKGMATRPEDFIPLTDVSVSCAINPQLNLRVATLVFNKHQLALLGEIRARTGALNTGALSMPANPPTT
jgi:hypothetical protein